MKNKTMQYNVALTYFRQFLKTFDVLIANFLPSTMCSMSNAIVSFDIVQCNLLSAVIFNLCSYESFSDQIIHQFEIVVENFYIGS